MKKNFMRIVLVFFCLYSMFFLIGSISAPIMAHLQHYELSAKLTSMFMFSCHQRPDRSFWILGYPVALCCRCLGFYLGVVCSTLLALFEKFKMDIKLFVILFLIAIVDITSNFVFNYNTGNIIRFTIGIIMGFLFTTITCYMFNYKKEKNYEIKEIN